jgi:hypothetical protein
MEQERGGNSLLHAQVDGSIRPTSDKIRESELYTTASSMAPRCVLFGSSASSQLFPCSCVCPQPAGPGTALHLTPVSEACRPPLHKPVVLELAIIC